MQTTSSGWAVNVAKPHRRIGQGLLIDWLRTTASGVKYFTIGQSRIGGPDIIKSGGNAIAFFDKYAYKDYSQYVVSWNVKRTIGQLPWGTILAQADLELDNTTKKFLPNFDTTIGSGILPNRPVKISMGIEGEFMQKFVGFAGMPELTLAQRRLTLHAYDVFDFFNSLTVSYSGVMQNKRFDEIVSTILTDNGFSSNQFQLDRSLQSPIPFFAPNNLKAGTIFQDGTEAEQALMFADENGIIRLWNRQHFLTTSGTLSFNLSYSSLEDLQWSNTPVINHVIVTAKPRALGPKKSIFSMSGTIQVPAGGDFVYTADFVDKDGNLPVADVDPPQYYTIAPTSWYATNMKSDGSGSAGNQYIYVKSAFLSGTQYVVVFHNTYTSDVYVTALNLYGKPASITSTIKQEYFDQSSISNYGRNPSNNGEPIEIENDLIQDNSQAYTLAYTMVKEYKDPRKRYKAPVAVGSNPAWQIGDFGRLTIQDTLEVKNVWIVGMEEGLDRTSNMKQILELEERNIRSYFTIGRSSIGGRDAIAP